jgi:hypothetical protein
MNINEKFMVAFEGFSAAHGQTKISEERRAGKQKALSFIVRQPLTLSLVESHINGFKGVGSIPINEENKCKFGALDIDQYPLDLVGLDKKIRGFKIPAVVCRSKSGGAHIFFFFKEWIGAGEFRDKASEISSILGFGNCEIFPKQEQVLVERGDVGNFINLPYFDSEQTMRYAVKEDGEEATLEEFKESPPCISTMAKQGIPEGGRNTSMFNAAVMFKKMDPDNWKSLLENFNITYCVPPLPASDIVTIQGQLDKKEYFYTCDQQPLCSFCNKTLCKTKKYGIGNQTQTMDISGLSVVLSEPRVWFADVETRRLELSTEDLQVPLKFQRQCMEQLNYMPPVMKNGDWQALINSLLENVNEIEVPEELTYKGQFLELLENYCTGRVQAQSAEELSLGKPWTEDGATYFKLDSLMQFLRAKKFDSYSRGQIQERLKELNENQSANGNKKFKNTRGEWKNVRVWWVPEFNSEVQVPSIEIQEEEVPF